MRIKNYNELNSLELDTLREVGSIGTGNAATALSALIGEEVRIELPEVRIMEYNEAIEWIGGPEEITAGVLVKMSGQIDGSGLEIDRVLAESFRISHRLESGRFKPLSDRFALQG